VPRPLPSTMPNDTCDCCDGDRTNATARTGDSRRHDDAASGTPDETATETPDDGLVERVLSGDAPLDDPLPADLGRALGDRLRVDRVRTLREFAETVRDHLGGPVAVGDLCHAPAPTPHWGDHDGERHHFDCFYDAVVLAALRDGPVDVRTESPGGTVVEARAVGTDDLRVDPEGAVFSVGCAADFSPVGEPSHHELYDAVCPYVRAFPSAAAYDRWRRTVPAPTVVTGLDGATDLAAALVG
jgi:alkylmercury lyase